ncbi:symplekin domain-containing protein [Encephalitozoon hellem ATCC 50504]|uniref:Symplekin n=1 Tax=Encephalitozoon hellem TaxID=27973 RepID=A0A9Q9CCF6_ENCHE|nr:symplekin domain-containing protein [Encephalitozoon hellem ATCC 50504]AFM98444.1 symplekin domain-containing protein [Encephalitozoon hellem ATCC 50504]UTX43369.1 symplekin [Encephalitozoon hellem]|eukprot:XP_003887425.1 symplekin domain-containing protein [Encephalitozoon hellem ATCC 50504]
MEKIRYHLVERYSEEGLTFLIFYLRNMSPIETVYFFCTALKVLDRDSAVALLAYLRHAHSKGMACPRYAQRSVNYHVHMLNKRIAKKIPSILGRFASEMKLFDFTEVRGRKVGEEVKRELDPFSLLIDLVFETLVKSSNIEIENTIQTYFHEKQEEERPGPVTEAFNLLGRIKEAGAIDVGISRIVRMLDPRDSLDALVFMSKNERYSHSFFMYAYLLNRDVYDAMVDLILESRQYFRVDIVKHLVSLDIEKVLEKITDETVEILGHMVKERRAHVKEIVEMISEGRVNVSRENVLEVFKENYETLGEYASYFKLSDQELIEVSKSNDDALPLALDAVDTQESMNSFVDLLKEKEDSAVINLIKSMGEDQRKEALIQTILRRRVVKGQLRVYLLDNYSDDDRFIYDFLPYLEKSDVYKYIPDYVVDAESLNTFLKVIECSELLIFAHKIPDVSKAIRILDLCFKSPRFSESDFLFTLTTLEKELPLLIVRTLIQTLLKFPNLKNFVVSFLSRLARRNIWKQEEMVEGVVRCFEIVGPAAVDIVMYLDPDAMSKALGKSKGLRSLCREYLRKEASGKRHDSALRSVLSKFGNK